LSAAAAADDDDEDDDDCARSGEVAECRGEWGVGA
jgi:hypothetical protein